MPFILQTPNHVYYQYLINSSRTILICWEFQ